MLEQPSCPSLILSDDKDNEAHKGQQQQEAGEDREQGVHNSDMSNSRSGSDYDHRDDQDSDDSEGPRPTKRRRPLPSSNDPTSTRSRKQHLQRPHHSRLTSPSKLARADLVPVRKETQQPSPLVSDNSDSEDSEAAQLTKRRRPSPSNSVFNGILNAVQTRHHLKLNLTCL